MKKRRLTFQLTPLLDLLLIVIFAQYMEVQQKAESAQSELQAQKAELENDYAAKQAQLQQKLTEETARLNAERQRYSEYFESILEQHQRAGSALADALNLPGTMMEQILRLQAAPGSVEAQNLQAAADQLKQELQSRGLEVLEFILRYDEMQKHVSVWEIHLADNGQAQFSDGDILQPVSFGTREEFVSRAFEASKAFTEPKPLVIILLSYGDTQAGQRRRATDGMPLLMEKLRQDAGNTRWFDFSLMGFRPNGLLINGNRK